MMRLGIVGHEAAKFTADTEYLAKQAIAYHIEAGATEVVSGACHLGGIDIWAVEVAHGYGLPTLEYPPEELGWEYGYKPRNIRIAENSDKVICIVVKKLPESYQGMRFPYCYHCKTDSHIKSGGCWTARYAGRIGKPYEIIEIG
jgi:hypothetical protein